MPIGGAAVTGRRELSGPIERTAAGQAGAIGRREPGGAAGHFIFSLGGDPGLKRFHRPYLPSDRAFEGLPKADP